VIAVADQLRHVAFFFGKKNDLQTILKKPMNSKEKSEAILNLVKDESLSMDQRKEALQTFLGLAGVAKKVTDQDVKSYTTIGFTNPLRL
jgi:hypothetical protein